MLDLLHQAIRVPLPFPLCELWTESTTSGLCKNLLIGVMTSPALLSTRALAIAESWGRHAANIQFYVGNSTDEETLLSEEYGLL